MIAKVYKKVVQVVWVNAGSASVRVDHNFSVKLTPQDIVNGYVSLPIPARDGSSIIAFFQKAQADETVDFTRSTVDGVTRITWIGDYLPGGTNPMAADDRVSFFYKS